MKLTLGISPCPNDLFMFDALINQKIDTENIEFIIQIADIEQLNRQALENTHDITKISFSAFSKIQLNYKLLKSGCALGKNNGPLLISKKKVYPDEINYLKVAIPGRNTTANLILTIAFPDIKQKKEYLFSDIEDVVLSGDADAGLIIHETRFSYEKKGLKKIIDLGEYWESTTNHPLPLGAIAIKRTVPEEIQKKVNNILKLSIQFAFQNPKSSLSYIKKYSRELDDQTIRKHIDLYVNEFSLDIGEKGKNAIIKLLTTGAEKGILNKVESDMFID